jgi:hypothetical protein
MIAVIILFNAPEILNVFQCAPSHFSSVYNPMAGTEGRGGRTAAAAHPPYSTSCSAKTYTNFFSCPYATYVDLKAELERFSITRGIELLQWRYSMQSISLSHR